MLLRRPLPDQELDLSGVSCVDNRLWDGSCALPSSDGSSSSCCDQGSGSNGGGGCSYMPPHPPLLRLLPALRNLRLKACTRLTALCVGLVPSPLELPVRSCAGWLVAWLGGVGLVRSP
jgi:hypothetical protein